MSRVGKLNISKYKKSTEKSPPSMHSESDTGYVIRIPFSRHETSITNYCTMYSFFFGLYTY